MPRLSVLKAFNVYFDRFTSRIQMHNYIFLILVCFSFGLNGQESLNVSLIDEALSATDARYSGSWSYEDDNGVEYALVGARSGIIIYEIRPDGQLDSLAKISGPTSNWREITVLRDQAYISTEGSDSTETGMQVIELSQLPDTAFLIANYNEHFTRGHIIQRDIYSEEPYIYVMGTQTTQGVHIIDVSNPMEPVQVGLYEPGYYIHDAHVNGDLLFACAFNESKVDILDISDKTNPTYVREILDPGGNTHSAWLTEDKSHMILADELDGLPGRIFNIEDLEDIFEVTTFSSNLESLVHNPYIRGDFAFISHNTEGLRVYDVKDPTLPVEVGFYDTFDGPSGGFSGLWSACPYYSSGKIIGGDRTKGLMLWEFEETRAARIYGTVVDSITEYPIPNAEIIIPGLNDTLMSDSNGKFKYGFYPSLVDLEISASGYIDKLVELNLGDNDDRQLVVRLSQMGTNIKEVTSNFSLNLFPNPTSKEVILQFSSNLIGKTIDIVNGNGRLISNEKILSENLTINVEEFAKGLYFVNIKNKKGELLFAEKFIRD